MLGVVVALAMTVAGGVAQTGGLDNFDFQRGSLQGWQGEGFYLTAAQPVGSRDAFGVCSSDAGSIGRKGMLRYEFTVPPGVGMLQCKAFVGVKTGVEPDGRLDIVLAGSEDKVVPKQVRSVSGWSSAPRMLPRWQGKPRDYSWDVSKLVGQTLQIVLIDRDDRPEHYLYASSFQFIAAQQFHDHDFARKMLELQTKNRLAEMTRYDSKRFSAISNAGPNFTTERLQNCEIFYDQFLDHFRQKGFSVYPPVNRLMVAMFDSPAGFEAYLGQKLPSSIVGVYHTPTNRLVLYDLNENRAIVAQKKVVAKAGARMRNSNDRSQFLGTAERKISDVSKDANLSTTMHEAAHQIAFNCGLLNREGDNPCWLVEGMACYCESTDQGDWITLGGPNPMRIVDLARANEKYIPLTTLIQSDRWRNTPKVLVGYAQSWALYRMLMEENTPQLRQYLQTVATRRAPDYRLADFAQAFGRDLPDLERRYHAYMNDLIAKHPPQKVR